MSDMMPTVNDVLMITRNAATLALPSKLLRSKPKRAAVELERWRAEQAQALPLVHPLATR